MNVTKKAAALGLALTLCVGAGVGAYAASNNEAITALLNRDLKVIYNGVEQHFTDANGVAVYPISYNNSTYLPVRAISGLVGLPIDFNAEAYAVELGTKEVQPAKLVDLNNSGNTDYSHIIIDAEELTVPTVDGDKSFSNGIFFDIWNSFSSASKNRAVIFDVNGYKEITFTAWSDIASTVVVYDQDGGIMTEINIEAQTPTVKTLPLGATQTGIGFAADSQGWDSGTLKIFDASVK